MDKRLRDYIEQYGLTLGTDGFYHYGSNIFEEYQIKLLDKYGLEPDTEVNVDAIGITDSLDYIDGFYNGLHNALYYIDRLLYECFCDDNLEYQREIREIKNLLCEIELDYTSLIEQVKTEILNDMESSNRPKNPCDYPDNEGHYYCPYDAEGSDDCRRFCGLGVDE